MSSEALTLLGALQQHRGRYVVLHGSEQTTPAQLCHAAEQLRTRYPNLEQTGVALQSDNRSGLVQKLVALDGFARDILLLPPRMPRTQVAELADAAGVDYVLDDSGLEAFGTALRSRAEPGASRWLFTTSGTTGVPKIFSHTLSSLTSSSKLSPESPANRLWGLAYEAHRFAGIQVLLQALVGGDAIVIPVDEDMGSMLRSFVMHRVDSLSATPSQWRKLLSHGEILQCPLTQITLGGEIADQAILSALARAFPQARIVHIYASTEAGVGFSVSDGRAGFPAAWLHAGPPLEMKISSSGSLLIRSESRSDSSSLGSRVSEDGYLDTEDEVRIDNDRVYFLGRNSGIINVGGNKVHPEEVENVVRAIPGVENVRVRARKNPIMGQLVAMELQRGTMNSQESDAEFKRRVRDYCKQHMPAYKVPAMITLVPDLALSASGKIDRKQSA
jgi:acyl-CoA synthetase (AMP-forming)/AMP-acid ligase II